MRRLDSFDVPLAREGTLGIAWMDGESRPERDWTLLSFEPAPGFSGALALRALGRPVAVAHASR